MGYPHVMFSTPLNVVVSGFSMIELHKFYIRYVNTTFKIETKKCGERSFLLLLLQ